MSVHSTLHIIKTTPHTKRFTLLHCTNQFTYAGRPSCNHLCSYHHLTSFILTLDHGLWGWTPTPKETSAATYLSNASSQRGPIYIPLDTSDESDTDTPTPLPTQEPIPLPSTHSTKVALTEREVNRDIREKINREEAFPPELPVKQTVGKLSLMKPQPIARAHPATPLLDQYATQGCPTDCGDAWSKAQIITLLRKGPHISAKSKAVIRFLWRKTADKVKNGYARVVKWGSIKNNIPATLKISPVAMVPHKSKQFRVILDLSFDLYHNGLKFKPVNDSTRKHSRPEVMVQLGMTIHRLIATVLADNWTPTQPFKYDHTQMVGLTPSSRLP